LNQVTPKTTNELVELCREGDKQAFFVVYQRNAKPLLNTCMRILNNLADAEDLVQETFIDAFTHLHRFDNKCSFEVWLKRIIINKSVSLLRKRKISLTVLDQHISEKPETEMPDEEISQINIAHIKAAMGLLPRNQWIVFNLFAVDNLSQKEITHLLGLSHNNVRILYYRAKKKIIQYLNHVEKDKKTGDVYQESR